MDGDVLYALRRRLFELVSWFRQDAARLTAAQRVRHADPSWAVTVRTTVDAWMNTGATVRPLPVTGLAAADALLELEALDLAAHWLAGHSSVVAPPTRVGSGPDESYLVRLAHPRRPLASVQAGVLAAHLRYHAVIPTTIVTNSATFPVQIKRSPPWTSVPRDRVVLATTSFGDGAFLERGDDGSFVSVATAAQRGHDMVQALTNARACEVDVLVAPELTLPPVIRDTLIAHLQEHDGPSLLVPGSFHERVVLPDGTSCVVHQAMLLDRHGNSLLVHRKIAPFGKLVPGQPSTVEAFAPGNQITAIVTPIGLVAVAICKDFCDDDVQTVWQKVQPEWLLVPAYGDGASAHGAAAARIARMVGTVTVLAHEAMHSARREPDPRRPAQHRSANHSFVHSQAAHVAAAYQEGDDQTPYAPAIHQKSVVLTDGYDILAKLDLPD